jgi:2-polyprenyl-6-methoxyphenol hydroxylase-like FAD-dependent oxidoreductase
LWPNGVQALTALGLGAGHEAVATPVPPGGIRRPDGKWLQQPAAGRAYGAAVVVHGADLHDALVAGLNDHVDVRTGIEVRRARAGAERPAVGDGRSTWDADLIVAADGADSLVRRRLAPAVTLVSGGYTMWRAVLPAARAPRLAPGTEPGGETIGAGHRFRYAVLGESGSSKSAASPGGIYWVASVPGAARPEPLPMQLTLLRRWFAGWHPPIGDLLAATEPDDLVQEPVRQLRPLPGSLAYPAGIGGYVLLGDAGHAMTGHLAQGPGLALEDAATLQAVLIGVMSGRSLLDALDEYSRMRVPRAARLAAHARRVDMVLQARGRFSLAARFAPRTLDRAMASAADWRPPGR